MNLNSVATRAFAGFYELIPVGEPTVVKTAEMAEAIGVGTGAINQMRRILEYTDSMTYTSYKNPREGIAITTYTLKDDARTAAKKIAALPFSGFRELQLNSADGWKPDSVIYVAEEEAPKPEPKPIKTFEALAPLRKSEPRAAVEATRQYLAKWDIAKEHARALFDAGLVDDTATVLDNLKLDRDDQLDTIAKILPYIDELEHQVLNLERFQETLKAKAAKVDDLEVALRRSKEQNTRLIASRTQVAANGS